MIVQIAYQMPVVPDGMTFDGIELKPMTVEQGAQAAWGARIDTRPKWDPRTDKPKAIRISGGTHTIPAGSTLTTPGGNYSFKNESDRPVYLKFSEPPWPHYTVAPSKPQQDAAFAIYLAVALGICVVAMAIICILAL